MHLFRVAVVVSALALSGVRADQVTIATLNVENFFDDLDAPYRWDEFTPPKSPEGVVQLAAFLGKLDADLVALQEVESREVLEAFNRQHLGNRYAHVVCLEGNDGRGIDVALLSKLPVLSATTYQHRRWPPINDIPYATGFARDALRVQVQATERAVVEVFVLHLKSKSGGAGSDRWRQRETTEIRSILAALASQNPTARICVLGDFNDLPEAPPLQPLFDPNASPRLFDLTTNVPLADRWSYIYRGQRQQLDYLTATASLKESLVAGSVQFHRLPDVATDHSALSAVFDLPGSVHRAVPSMPPWVPLEAYRPSTASPVLAATDQPALRNRLGYWTRVTGKVRQVFFSPTGKVCYLNFEGVNRGFSGVIFANSFARFPQLRSLEGKSVILEGLIGEYQGNLQIILNEATQLKTQP